MVGKNRDNGRVAVLVCEDPGDPYATLARPVAVFDRWMTLDLARRVAAGARVVVSLTSDSGSVKQVETIARGSRARGGLFRVDLDVSCANIRPARAA